ncbi:MAG: ATP-dependent helicase HrpB [Phycisphaerales bacterium]|nr:ATP-dependent helicase HrpB [Phycisphaerales bacterium]
MQPLPIDPHLPAILHALRRHRNLVLLADPGAGKTTRLPPAILPLLEAGSHPQVLILQPRRIAARAAAARIAQEHNWRLGREVGYHIRFDRLISPDTRLQVLTEGILTRRLLEDASLEGVGCVILDEFHERSIHSDLALALLREVQQTIRPDLRLIVMSATLDAAPISRFLDDAPVFEIPGRRFPVQIEHRPRRGDRDIETAVVDEIAELLQDGAGPGDVLVFLPGAGEIQRVEDSLRTLARQEDALVLPLHGALANHEQLRALQPARQRKIILATNIAETSLTIDGVTCVIDSGLHRIAGYDPRRGMDTLTLAPISRASADQRAGRAGRTAPGRAIRLWPEREHHDRPAFDPPEIARVDLAPTLLSLHAWGCQDPRRFAFFQPPPEAMLASAERLLVMLGALDATPARQITALGRRMARLPAHPRLARLLLEAQSRGVPQRGAAVAALLSEKDILRRDFRSKSDAPQVRADSDLSLRLSLLRGRQKDRVFDAASLARVNEAIRQFSHLLRRMHPERQGQDSPSPETSEFKSCPSVPSAGAFPEEWLVLLAYPDRVCRMRDRSRRAGVMVGGGGVRLSGESAVMDAEFFVAVDARHDPAAARAESVVRIACRIERDWLNASFPQSIRHESAAEFDPSRQRVAGVARIFYHDLLLEEQENVAVDEQTAARVLAEALTPRASQIIESDPDAAAFLARLDLLRRSVPEHGWPVIDGDFFHGVLQDACRGKRAVSEIDSAALVNAIRARLPVPLERLMDELAPAAIVVPSGSRIRLSYIRGQPPRLAVRLQELFGLTATPRVCSGRVSVIVELLGPNYRPVQVTSDLESFWRNTYPRVRKDLRARYPRHAWPEDPLSAPPQAKRRPSA